VAGLRPGGLWVGATAGVTAASSGAAAAAAGVVAWPVGLGLGALSGAAAVAPLLWQRRSAGRDVAQAWAEVAAAGPAGDEAVAAGSPLERLNPDRRVVSFARGRRAELHAVLDWCAGGAAAVWAVAGGAGEGKTRLLVEACGHLAGDGWVCGWVRRGREAAAVEVAGRWGRPVLLVVDDADTRAGLAELLVAARRRPGRRVRVVLAAREFGEWWSRLREGLAPELAGALAPAHRTALGRLAATAGEQQQRFGQAVDAFARTGGTPAPQARLAGAAPATPLVLVHAAAAVAVERSLSGPVDLDAALRWLFDAEESWWQARATAHGLGVLGPKAVQAAVVAAVLLGAAGRDEAAGMLAHLPGLAGAGTAQRSELAVWLHGLYPQKAGEWLARTCPPGSPNATSPTGWPPTRRCWPGSPQPPRPGASRDRPRQRRGPGGADVHRAGARRRPHPRRRPGRRRVGARPAGPAAGGGGGGSRRRRADRPGPRLAAVAALPLTAEVLDALAAAIPYPTRVLAHTAAAVAQARLAHADTGEQRAERLTTLGIRRSGLGRWEQALAATEEAVAVWRRLAAARPEAFVPDLATALSNLGAMLWGLGRREEAVTATEEALGILRRLAAARPDAFEPHVATALNNLGLLLWGLGRWEEALAAAEEALDILRRLAAAHPDAFEPDLAQTLNNLGADLSGLGRQEEALTASEEALGIRRRLAAAHPDAFEPTLATALDHLGAMLSGLGRWEEALAATEEALGILRRLAATRPNAFEPHLATALINLGVRLSGLGRREEALAATEEAVDIRRRLAARYSRAFRDDLAVSEANLRGQRAALGLDPDSL
jgi:tetratricopeptide (TPR) repeat protein